MRDYLHTLNTTHYPRVILLTEIHTCYAMVVLKIQRKWTTCSLASKLRQSIYIKSLFTINTHYNRKLAPVKLQSLQPSVRSTAES